MPSRWFRGLAAAALAVAAAVALALYYLDARLQPPAAAATPDRLSISLPVAPHSGLVAIAAAKGYFAAVGLEVTLLPAPHGKAAIESVVGRNADLALAALLPVAVAVTQGEALAIAASVASVSDLAIVARRDRGIAAPGDLAGKRVGASFGTGGEYFLHSFLIRQAIAPAAVTLVDVPPGGIARALAAGAIDAASTWQPILAEAHSSLGANALSLTEEHANGMSFVAIGRGAYLKGHPRAIEKLMRALLQAERLANEQPEEAIAIVAAWSQIEASALRLIWESYRFALELRQSEFVALESAAGWAMARGYARQGPPPNFIANVYLDALLAVDARRVTVVR